MITEDYVSFETAKLLKEKGFDDEYTNAFYDKSGILYFIDLLSDFSEHPDNNTDIAASTLYMAMKWLRKKYNFSVEVHFFLNEENDISSWNYDIIDTVTYCNKAKYDMRESFKTFEEACEAALKYCLEYLI